MLQSHNVAKHRTITVMESYENLANAIIVEAAKDYRLELIQAKHNGLKKDEPLDSPTERFFHSDWYRALTDVDPDVIIKKMRNVVYGDDG